VRYAEYKALRNKFWQLLQGVLRPAALVLVITTLPSVQADASADLQAVRLLEGETVAREQTGREELRYAFEARQGRSYLLEIAQDRLDLVISIEAPDGSRQQYGSPLFRNESEFVMLHGSQGGLFFITLFANESPDSMGAHTIRVTDTRVSKTQKVAWRLLNDAAASNVRGDRQSQLQALRNYEAAAMLLHFTANAREQAFALYAAAMLNYWVLGEWHRADQLAANAALLYAATGLPRQQANAILLQAMTLTEAITETTLKDPILERVSELLAESYAIHKRLGSAVQLARIRYFNALSHFNAGHYEQAKRYYLDAARLFRELGDWSGERGVLLDRAVIDIDIGNSIEAIDTLQELQRSELQSNPNPSEQDLNFIATVLDQLGTAHKNAGNIDEALAAFTSAQEMHSAVGDLHGEAESLRGVAGLYLELGDLENARTFLGQAQEVAEASNNGRVLGVIHTTLGNIEYSAANFEAAKDSQRRALELTPEAGPVRAHREILLARTLVALGEFDEASTLATRALADAELSGSPRSEADALRQMGMALDGLQRLEDSIAALEQARRHYESLGLTDGLAAVENALSGSLARVALADPDPDQRTLRLDEALERSSRSLDYVDRLLSKVSTPELRAWYGASYRDYYQSHIDLLLQRNGIDTSPDHRYVSEALSTSERARARMMMDLLNEASVDLQRDIDPDIAAEMDELIDKLSKSNDRRERILAQGGVDDRARGELVALSEEIAFIENQLVLKQVELRRVNHHYRALTAPDTVTVSELQRLIDSDSVMLQYYLAKDRSFVWVVTDDAVHVRQIAGSESINAASARLIASLRSPNLDADAGTDQADALRSVSELVLQPVADLIGAQRVIVVADGMLNYLPFHTLLLAENDDVSSLLDTREVVALPSMSVLAALRKRHTEEDVRRSIAIFADPVFNLTDPRLVSVDGRPPVAQTQSELAPNWATRSVLSGDLPRLQGTRNEAMAIAELFADDPPLIALGFEASRNSVFASNLRDYRILHFATHGMVDRRSPELSSLVLSRFDSQGEPQNGYLRLHDIYRLDLNADLVVLSACETGLGTDISGEGLVGLTQGFLYAGARSLLISLWDVPDAATAELMTRFYGHVTRDNMRPAEALRLAQVSMASDRRWRDPYFWGAFILLGDWM
jgi:CHAT domain-containing protein